MGTTSTSSRLEVRSSAGEVSSNGGLLVDNETNNSLGKFYIGSGTYQANAGRVFTLGVNASQLGMYYYGGSFSLGTRSGSAVQFFTNDLQRALIHGSSGNMSVGTALDLGQLAVVNTNAAQTGVVVRGAASQTADLQQWQGSAGTVLATLSATGRLGLGTSPSNKLHVVDSRDSTSDTWVARFTNSSTAANADGVLIESGGITDNSNPFVVQRSDGTKFLAIQGNGFINIGNVGLGSNIAKLAVVADLSSYPALVTRAAPSQSADIQQWQNSAGTVLAKIDASGNLTVKNANVEGAYITFSNNIRGYNVSVLTATSTQTVTFSTAHADANYAVFCTPDWNTTCFVTNKTTTGFTLNFGTTAPAGQLVDWLVIR